MLAESINIFIGPLNLVKILVMDLSELSYVVDLLTDYYSFSSYYLALSLFYLSPDSFILRDKKSNHNCEDNDSEDCRWGTWVTK